MQAPHVAANTRNPEESGSAIDELLEHDGVELLLTRQIDEDAGIEIAAARAHDDPAGRGQAHAGVDRFSPFDRGDACAIAEMGDDQSVWQRVGKLVHDRFQGKAVKPVTLDALRLQFLGNGEDTSY